MTGEKADVGGLDTGPFYEARCPAKVQDLTKCRKGSSAALMIAPTWMSVGIVIADPVFRRRGDGDPFVRVGEDHLVGDGSMESGPNVVDSGVDGVRGEDSR
ncbi:MAG: hypothetical protein ACLQPH_11985 [Acidimicrobiales bacterium]